MELKKEENNHGRGGGGTEENDKYHDGTENRKETRMHSSRMRTIHCSGRLIWGEVSAQGVSARWGCLPGRGYLQGECTPPPCGQTDACENITFPQQ